MGRQAYRALSVQPRSAAPVETGRPQTVIEVRQLVHQSALCQQLVLINQQARAQQNFMIKGRAAHHARRRCSARPSL